MTSIYTYVALHILKPPPKKVNTEHFWSTDGQAIWCVETSTKFGRKVQNVQKIMYINEPQ